MAPTVPEGRWWAEDVFGLSPEFPKPTPDKPIVEGVEDLGGGFRRVRLAEFITGGFESIYHGEYLFYQDRQLGDFSPASISPDQTHAAFLETDFEHPMKEGRYGYHVLVFRVDGLTTERMTNEVLFDFLRLEWDGASGDLLLWRKGIETPLRFSVR